jgi:two-component system chemotaxis response regulator CheB
MSTIRVALADDSSFIRQAVAHLLSQEPDLQLVGSASRGEDLLRNLEIWAPDAIVLDLSMPGMSGLEVLAAIMQRRPTPVIILSTHSQRGAPLTLEALDRGAVDFIDKQEYSLLDFDRLRDVLLSRIRSVSRMGGCAVEPADAAAPQVPAIPPGLVHPEVILLGASTGGPPAIERILSDLGAGVKTPILVTQHMPGNYIRAFAERLDKALPLAVHEAQDGTLLEAGTVVLAPGEKHLGIVRDLGLRTRLTLEPFSLYGPSVDVLLCSAA